MALQVNNAQHEQSLTHCGHVSAPSCAARWRRPYARNLSLEALVWGLILSYFILSVPLACVLMGTFFLSIPRELEEAAEVDGASNSMIRPPGGCWEKKWLCDGECSSLCGGARGCENVTRCEESVTDMSRSSCYSAGERLVAVRFDVPSRQHDTLRSNPARCHSPIAPLPIPTRLPTQERSNIL